MNHLRKIIQESIQIAENVQLADKVYFNKGLLSPEVKRYILHITGGDAWTKLIADIYYAELQQRRKTSKWALSVISGEEEEEDEEPEHGKDDVLDLEYWKVLKERYYSQLKFYNKNVFPIAGLDPNGAGDIWEISRALYQRYLILQEIKKLPSIAMRNLREDFRKVRNSKELSEYRNNLEYFNSHYQLLSNRSPQARAVIEKKMFRSGVTIEDLVDFVDEKENLIGGKRLSKGDVKKIIKEHSYDLEIVYEKGNVMIVNVTGPDGIKALGCNSVWCFTYGFGVYRNRGSWSENSTNGQVYVIIDFSQSSDSSGFMYVVVKPLNFQADPDDETENDNKMANLSNEYIDTPLATLSHIMDLNDAYQIINFGEDRVGPNSKWPFEDPNQLKLDLQEARKMIRKLFFETLETSRVYIGKERGITAFLRNIDSEVSPYIHRVSDTEVNIEPQAFIMEPALEGEGGMLDFFGLTPKFSYGLNESKKKSKFSKLEDNKIPLTDEERKKVMDADAIWHHGPGGAPSPAVWKSKDPKTGDITYVTNTHRAYNTAPTLKGAIGRYHKFIKGTS